MNTEKLNYLLDDLKGTLDEVRSKHADQLTKRDVNKIGVKYDALYAGIKAQLAFIGQTWTILLRDRNHFLTSVPGKFLSESQAEEAARLALDENEDGVSALLYCDGVHIKTM